MTKVALVTGGTRGIGASISRKLKADGFAVAAVYASNDSIAAGFRKETGINVFKFNVTEYAAVENGISEILKQLGHVDVLVNNAGITRDSFMHKMTADQWHEVIDTNLSSCFNTCRVVVPSMREKGYGRIINISSINGQKGQIGQTNYSAAKAGIIGFTKALALENATKGITVNCICPGYTETEMTSKMTPETLKGIVSQVPLGRLGQPEDIARTVSFLAAEEASFITGSTFSINGGHYMA